MQPEAPKAEGIFVDEPPRDDVLPQLSVVLNAAYMHQLFQTKLFDTPTVRNRFRIQACNIMQLRYKRGTKCMICYRLVIRDIKRRQVGEQILCAGIFQPTESFSRFTKAQSQHVVSPNFGQPLTHIPELEMVVWAFPNDRKLHTLPKVIDPPYIRREIVPRIMATHLGPEWLIGGVQDDIVHYVGEHTCTLRVEIQMRRPRTRENRLVVLYGKTYDNEEGAETYRLMQELWNSDARRKGQLAIAEPLAYDQELKTVWQLGLRGSTLLTPDLHSTHTLTLLERAACSVAALHRTPLSCIKTCSFDDWVGKLHEVATLLVSVRPACRQALCPLVDRLFLQAEQFKDYQTGTLHGDLHLKNFLTDAGGVALIDLDNLCSGPPLQDVGSFIANLYYRGIAGEIPQSAVTELVRVFISAYEARVDWRVSRPELAWYVAVALVIERAFRSVTRLKAGRLDILDVIIDLANQISLGKCRFGADTLVASGSVR
jgi:hypothetical protein